MSDTTVAQNILNQMGGRRVQVMVNGRDFVYDDNSVSFKFSGSQKTNQVHVKLNGMDTYNVTFYKWKPQKLEHTKVKEVNGIYAEDLKPFFEDTTGLYLSL